MYIDELFDISFNMGYRGGGGLQRPSPWFVMGWKNRPWTKGLKKKTQRERKKGKKITVILILKTGLNLTKL